MGLSTNELAHCKLGYLFPHTFHQIRDGKPAHGHYSVFVGVFGAMQVGYHGAAVSGLIEVMEELDVGV